MVLRPNTTAAQTRSRIRARTSLRALWASRIPFESAAQADRCRSKLHDPGGRHGARSHFLEEKVRSEVLGQDRDDMPLGETLVGSLPQRSEDTEGSRLTFPPSGERGR